MSTLWRRRVALLALLFGLGFTLRGAYIPAKAWLAQRLLEAAWQKGLAGSPPVRPWPWADMTPLARLRQPRLGIDQIVLDDASGRSLAFGPGHVVGSARPGQPGNVVISAHRDTHFRWLAALRAGDELQLQNAGGVTRRYAVVRMTVHHATEVELLDPLAGDQLRLVTCYPFDAVLPGTTLRYVVTAMPRAS
ncbi:MAG: class GN sortase [Chromatiaceae bacterium]|jgi:sortase A|nr:class GN sortase [Chromatiaceae bacterium]